MFGVIDIGSNSVRLMLQGDTKTKYVNTTGLARGSLDGYLQKDSINRTIDAIVEYKNLALKKGAKSLYIFATEAVRSSKNRQDFIDLVKEKTGVNLVLIPAEREAEMGFYGAYTTGECLVIDIGGASTEIVVGNSEEIHYKKSVPIGIIRILDNVKNGVNKQEYIQKMLKKYGDIPKADICYAIGGTAGTIAAVNEQLEVYDINVTHNYKLSLELVDYWQKRFASLSTEEIANLKGMDIKRAEIIEGGTNLLYEIMKMLKVDKVFVSENDNLEGFVKLYDIKEK